MVYTNARIHTHIEKRPYGMCVWNNKEKENRGVWMLADCIHARYRMWPSVRTSISSYRQRRIPTEEILGFGYRSAGGQCLTLLRTVEYYMNANLTMGMGWGGSSRINNFISVSWKEHYIRNAIRMQAGRQTVLVCSAGADWLCYSD